MRLIFIAVGPDSVMESLNKMSDVELFKVWRMKANGSAPQLRGKLMVAIENAVNFSRLLCKPIMYRSDVHFICSNSHYSCLLFIKWLNLLGRKQKVYIYNLYLHGLGQKKAIRSLLKCLLNTNVGMMVQSKHDLDYFKSISKSAHIKYSPYCRNEISRVDKECIKRGDYIFSGGYTNRDYNSLLKCAAKLPDNKFIIVCSKLNALDENVPSNVQVIRDIGHREFNNLLAGSHLVILPLKNNVGASGQMVALAGMQFYKTVIYPDFDVVSQYFEDGVSGIMYKHADQDSMCEQLKKALSCPDSLVHIGANARERWKRYFTQDKFSEAIVLDIQEYLGFLPPQQN